VAVGVARANSIRAKFQLLKLHLLTAEVGPTRSLRLPRDVRQAAITTMRLRSPWWRTAHKHTPASPAAPFYETAPGMADQDIRLQGLQERGA
jgi:hypothetical protein